MTPAYAVAGRKRNEERTGERKEDRWEQGGDAGDAKNYISKQISHSIILGSADRAKGVPGGTDTA